MRIVVPVNAAVRQAEKISQGHPGARSDELTRRRQELPWVRIDKDYRFETDEGMQRMG
jgi:predicted dithiol-disulfide oxidoreductase (DUF899 family)